MTALGNAKSEDDVKDAFDVTSTPEIRFGGDSIMFLGQQLKRANDLLDSSMKYEPPSSSQPSTTVINMPEQKAATFNVTTPEQNITVNVPKQEMPAPIINVHVPKQDAPVINVNVPGQKPPIVNVNVTKEKPKENDNE
jgi:hypothetical protein